MTYCRMCSRKWGNGFTLPYFPIKTLKHRELEVPSLI